jgi:predicted RNase H-like HicB family nuclease
MSIGELEIELNNTNGKSDPVTLAEWVRDGVSACHCYHCDTCFIKEDDGAFSAVILNLPGAGSCGPTIEDAERNAREAVRGVIESYNEHHEEIPWENSISSEAPEGTVARKWVLVHA